MEDGKWLNFPTLSSSRSSPRFSLLDIKPGRAHKILIERSTSFGRSWKKCVCKRFSCGLPSTRLDVLVECVDLFDEIARCAWMVAGVKGYLFYPAADRRAGPSEVKKGQPEWGCLGGFRSNVRSESNKSER